MPKFNCGGAPQLTQAAKEAYRGAMLALREAGLPHLVGGAYAFAHYTGVTRQTKDFDLFIRPADCGAVLSALAAAGFSTGVVFPFWLAKAFSGEHMIDLIYRAPNGVVEVTDRWFERAFECQLLDVPVRACAPEEILIMKLFVLNNDRTDLADVMHLFYSCAERIDWPHLLELLGAHWRLLLGQLILFGYIYPSERHRIPRPVMAELTARLRDELDRPAPVEPVCYGTMLSHSQYGVDLASGRFLDGRLLPHGAMTGLDLLDATISTDDPNRPTLLQAALLSGSRKIEDGS